MSIERCDVYVGMCADLVHHGHVRILQEAARYGRVTVGLLTDEAIVSYKRQPILSYEERYEVISNFRQVYQVVPQATLDYRPNLCLYKPQVVVHGDDWKTGPQVAARQAVIETLQEWKGRLVEPTHTAGVSTTNLIERIKGK